MHEYKKISFKILRSLYVHVGVRLNSNQCYNVTYRMVNQHSTFNSLYFVMVNVVANLIVGNVILLHYDVLSLLK